MLCAEVNSDNVLSKQDKSLSQVELLFDKFRKMRRKSIDHLRCRTFTAAVACFCAFHLPINYLLEVPCFSKKLTIILKPNPSKRVFFSHFPILNLYVSSMRGSLPRAVLSPSARRHVFSSQFQMCPK